MDIIFSKRTNQKHIISYKRKGKADFWMEADEFFVLHDLSHYAIETTLKYTTAFWGLIKEGINPDIFENKALRDKLTLSNEAWYTECMANLFLMELSQGGFENIENLIDDSLGQTNPEIPAIKLTSVEIDNIRITFTSLVTKWKSLNSKDSLLLKF
jgi:hypothetical protein